MDPEPPRPQWLVQSELMNTVSMLAAAESSHQMEDTHTSETAANLIQELMENLDTTLPEVSLSSIHLVFAH